MAGAVLITGGTGYLGQFLVQYFALQGCKARARSGGCAGGALGVRGVRVMPDRFAGCRRSGTPITLPPR